MAYRLINISDYSFPLTLIKILFPSSSSFYSSSSSITSDRPTALTDLNNEENFLFYILEESSSTYRFRYGWIQSFLHLHFWICYIFVGLISEERVFFPLVFLIKFWNSSLLTWIVACNEFFPNIESRRLESATG